MEEVPYTLFKQVELIDAAGKISKQVKEPFTFTIPRLDKGVKLNLTF
jgi:hypothetical protein